MSGVPLVPISPPLRHARLYAPHGSWCRPETRGALPVRDAGLFTGCPPPPTSRAGTRLARGQAGCWRPACPEHTRAWKPPWARVPVHDSPPVGAAGSSPGEVTKSPASSGWQHSGGAFLGPEAGLWVGSLPYSKYTGLLLPSEGRVYLQHSAAPGQGHRVVFLWQVTSQCAVENGEGRKCSFMGFVRVRRSNPREGFSAGFLAMLSRVGIPGSRIPVIGFLVFPSEWALTD